MATTPAQRKAIETKALKAGSKSAGMRELFDAGYSVREIADVFDAPYGFVYGVGIRHGAIQPEPRAEKAEAPKAKATRPAAKAAAPVKATKAAAKPAPRAAAPKAKAATKTARARA